MNIKCTKQTYGRIQFVLKTIIWVYTEKIYDRTNYKFIISNGNNESKLRKASNSICGFKKSFR